MPDNSIDQADINNLRNLVNSLAQRVSELEQRPVEMDAVADMSDDMRDLMGQTPKRIMIADVDGKVTTSDGLKFDADENEIRLGDVDPAAPWPNSNSLNIASTYVVPPVVDTSIYFTSSASDIGGIYKLMQSTLPGAMSWVAHPVIYASGTTALLNFATAVDLPGVTVFPAGDYTIHAHLYYAVGSGTPRTLSVYAEFYKRATGGAETLLGTSDTVGPLPVSETPDYTLAYDFTVNIPDDLDLDISDRFVIKWYSITTGGDADAAIVMSVGGTADSGLIISQATPIPQKGPANVFLTAFSPTLAPFTTWMRGRGTNLAPSAVLKDNALGLLRGRGYDGTFASTSVQMEMITDENHAPGAHGTRLNFYTTPNGTNLLTLAMSLMSNGNVDIGAGKQFTAGGIPVGGGKTYEAGAGITIDETDPDAPVISSVGRVNHSQAVFTIEGVVSLTGVKPIRVSVPYVGGGAIIEEVYAVLNTAPTTTAVRANVLKNGTSIFSGTQYVELATSVSVISRTTSFASTALAKDDYLTIEVVQGDVAASDLSVHVRYRWTSDGFNEETPPYVPYTGATTDVDLGTKTLVAASVNGLTAAQATELTGAGETALHTHAGVVAGLTITPAVGGNTTLLASSTKYQQFIGTNTQNCILPDVTTLQLGWQFVIDNNSEGAVSVKSSGGGVIIAVPYGGRADLVCVALTGTDTGAWDYQLIPNNILQTSRLIYTTAPLTIGGGSSGDLSDDRTIAMPAATNLADGYFPKEDKAKLDGMAAGAQPGTVTAVSVANANGVSGTSSGGTTPALTIALGAITPTTVNGAKFATVGSYLEIFAELQTSKASFDLSNSVFSLSTAAGERSLQIAGVEIGKILSLAAADNYTLTIPATGTALVKTGTLTTGYIPFGVAGSLVGEDSALFWDNTNKRLGIGTTAPGTKIDIRGTARINTDAGNYNSDGNPLYFGVDGSPTNISAIVPFGNNTGLYGLKFQTYNSGLVTAMTIINGNVGIGTTAPGSKLSVVGLTDYANNAAAVTAGKAAGDFYTETGTNPKRVCVVY